MSQTLFEVNAGEPVPGSPQRASKMVLSWTSPDVNITISEVATVFESTQGQTQPRSYDDVTVRRAKSALARPKRDISAIVRKCRARREAAWYEHAKQRLRHLSQLSANWNSYGAQAPNEFALYWAGEALDILVSLKLEPTGVVPSAENGVALVFKRDGKHADIEFFNNGDIAYLTDDGVDVPQAHDITADQESIGIALHKMRVFLDA